MKINIQKINVQGLQGLINKITQDKKKLLLVAMVAIFILYLDCSFVLKSQNAAIKAINIKKAKIKNDLDNLKLDLARMKGPVAKATPKTKRIIPGSELSWMIEEIYRLGSEYNVKIVQITPGREAKSAKAGSGTTYLTLPFNIEVSCGYHSLIKFLKALEAHSVIMAVEELEIIRSQKDIFFHEVKLILNIYVKK